MILCKARRAGANRIKGLLQGIIYTLYKLCGTKAQNLFGNWKLRKKETKLF